MTRTTPDAMKLLAINIRKIGTGGSAGYDYLKATAEKHKIFSDLFDLSTFLIPRSKLPDLPAEIVKVLGFYFTENNKLK